MRDAVGYKEDGKEVGTKEESGEDGGGRRKVEERELINLISRSCDSCFLAYLRGIFAIIFFSRSKLT